jgi:putative transposase
MGTVAGAPVMPGGQRVEELPERVREALGDFAGAARKGLLALSVGVGLGVLDELMEAEVEEFVGPKGRHDRERSAVRRGHEGGEVTLGGRRVPVSRPRVRTTDGASEVELSTYRHFSARDQLTAVVLERMVAVVLERMLAGVSTRRYARAGEPVGSEVDELARSTSKSAVSREFVSRTREHLIELMSRPLEDLRLAALTLDGIELKGRCCVVALGAGTDGVKHSLGLWDGSTESAGRDRWRQGAAQGGP